MTTINGVVIGASVTMTAKEVEALCGNGSIRLVTCQNGRVVGGMGAVGFVEHFGVTDMRKFIEEIEAKRNELAKLAAVVTDNPRMTLYTFTRI